MNRTWSGMVGRQVSRGQCRCCRTACRQAELAANIFWPFESYRKLLLPPLKFLKFGVSLNSVATMHLEEKNKHRNRYKRGMCGITHVRAPVVALPNRKQQKTGIPSSDCSVIHLALQASLKPLPPRLSQ